MSTSATCSKCNKQNIPLFCSDCLNQINKTELSKDSINGNSIEKTPELDDKLDEGASNIKQTEMTSKDYYFDS